MSKIYFAISSNIKANSIVTFCSKKLQINPSDFIVVNDFSEFCAQNKIDDKKYFIQYTVSSGEFDAWVEIYTQSEFYSTIDNQVIFLKALSKALNEKIVRGDEELNPYSFILIEPSGMTSTIEVEYHGYNEKEEINFGKFYNHFFGQFVLKKAVDYKRLTTELSEVFFNEFNDFELQFSQSGLIINGDFDRNKSKFELLKDFQYHYDILPKGKQKWYSIKDKTAIFIKKMTSYSAIQGLDICLFPADYSEIKNIEGGSDSEDYCIYSTKGYTQKIGYKNRRKSW